MDTAKLALFVKMAETENMTKAAMELGYTQSAASYIIRNLEQELGDIKLFTRGREGSLLTPAGKSAISPAKEILYWEKQMYRNINRAINQSSAFRIAFLPSLYLLWGNRIINQMFNDHPKERIEVLIGDNVNLNRWIIEGDVDCGFNSLPKGNAFLSMDICKDPLVVLLPKSHPLAAKQSISVYELAGERFIRTVWDLYDDILNTITSYGIKMDIRNIAYQAENVFENISNGNGISVLPSTFLLPAYEAAYPNWVFRPITEGLSRTISLGVHNKSTSPLTRALYNTTINFLKDGTIYVPYSNQ